MMQAPGVGAYFFVSMLLFVIGLLGVFLRRNVVFVLMSIELLLNSANLALVSASHYVGNFDGQIMTIFVITLAACEAALGLALVIAMFRRYGTVDIDFLRLLRG